MNDRLWIYLLFPGLPFLILFLQTRIVKRRRAASRLPLFEMRRPAGFSLQERSDAQWDRVTFGITCVMLTAIAPALIYVAGASIWPALVLGFIFCPLSLHQLWRDWQPMPNYRLGLLGEQTTGGVLDSLRRDDARVFHDLVISEHGHTRNIDHLVIGPSGFLCIETKARRKKQEVPGDDWVIHFDGERIQFPDGYQDTSAIAQTLWNAQWLRRRAHQLTGGDIIPVIPVLVYPGWMIDRKGRGAVGVVNHNELRQLIPVRGPEISPRSLQILTDWLERECVVKLPAAKSSKRPRKRSTQHTTVQSDRTPVEAVAG